MGLDVYLYRYDDLADYERRSESAEAEFSALYDSRFGEEGSYEALSEEERSAFWDECRDIERKHGVGDGEEAGRYDVRFDSRIHPDHMYKVLYYRSSYNDGGLEAQARKLGVPGLYDVFGPEDRRRFAPDWADARGKAVEALGSWRERVASVGDVRVQKADWNAFAGESKITDEAAALAAYQKEAARSSMFDAYENSAGFFTKRPIEVLAVIAGSREFLGRTEPCHYLIVSEESPYDWYLQALEIVVESIEHVLAQPDPEKHVLHWSG